MTSMLEERLQRRQDEDGRKSVLEEMSRPCERIVDEKTARKDYAALIKDFDCTIATYNKSGKKYDINEVVAMYRLRSPKQEQALKDYYAASQDLERRWKDRIKGYNKNEGSALAGISGMVGVAGIVIGFGLTGYGTEAAALLGGGLVGLSVSIPPMLYTVFRYRASRPYRKEYKILRREALAQLVERA